MTRFALAALAASAALFGCAPRAYRADLQQLQYRAVFDLACHASALQLYQVDARTKIVVGCGRRLVYQEDCTLVGDSLACSWRLDTPIAEQWSWPRPLAERTEERSAKGDSCAPRAIQTHLFDPGITPRVQSTPEPASEDALPTSREAQPPARGRTIFDELESRR